ncbi:hypothetical protein QBC38DRAFT_449254 [Podospora fimiseda]|uniref:Uncharacterized protein n=1 Tax=Podospora fimiseda TaxID=252190 RepID=A0AAN6YM95_9PEZI|nr:hypothetical protein QBC38DRAFT_449254 [Podospora fimiseda]
MSRTGADRPNLSPCRVCDDDMSIIIIHPACMFQQGTSNWATAVVPEPIRYPHSYLALLLPSQPRVPLLDPHAPSGYPYTNSAIQCPCGWPGPSPRSILLSPVVDVTSSNHGNTSELPPDTEIDEEDISGFFNDNHVQDEESGTQQCNTCTKDKLLTSFTPGIKKCNDCRQRYRDLRDQRIREGKCARLGHPGKVQGQPCQVCKLKKAQKEAGEGQVSAKGNNRQRKQQ